MHHGSYFEKGAKLEKTVALNWKKLPRQLGSRCVPTYFKLMERMHFSDASAFLFLPVISQET